VVAAAPRVEGGVLTVGTVAAFLQLARRFFQPLQDLSDKYNTLQQAMASSERIFRCSTPRGRRWRTRRGGRARGPGPGRPEAARRPRTRGARPRRRQFDDVWFAYDLAGGRRGGGPRSPSGCCAACRFTVRPGETLALVGHTGAGKTTMINLLLRFYEPQRGRILLDGADIRDLPVDELRRVVGYVQQDIFLFAGDVATNIRLSAPLADEEVEAAAARVGADRVIRRLPMAAPPTGGAGQLA
jgi:ATP-binding cassette, subfamily B, multidrug efflux pump